MGWGGPVCFVYVVCVLGCIGRNRGGSVGLVAGRQVVNSQWMVFLHGSLPDIHGSLQASTANRVVRGGRGE
jgi:hypothetical protein